ncbi:MAG: AmmeMemoRadiSam system radical SAM enzyme [Candidatus Rifleibacteriota bacterium]
MKRRNFLKILSFLSATFCFAKNLKEPCSARPPERLSLNDFKKKGFHIHKARHYKTLENNLVNCRLCPNRCVIPPGKRGRCNARLNSNGQLYSLVYGNLSSISVDPIEKKPVFHLLPGTHALSVSAAGCVLSCKYCQNWQISQSLPEEVCNFHITPAELVEKAIELNCDSIAYTYNEPTVFFEFMFDTAIIARKKGLKNVMVSCGYINQEPLKELIEVMDIIKVDLKGFSEDFYKKVTGGRLEPVKKTIETLARNKKLLDIVCLIIPGLNDDTETCSKMYNWLLKVAGPLPSLFVSRYYPTYKLRNIGPTPVSKLENLRKLAIKTGLKYVYIGNVSGHEGEDTFCHNCGKLLIDRLGYQIVANNLKDGKCPYCKTEIPGIWN